MHGKNYLELLGGFGYSIGNTYYKIYAKSIKYTYGGSTWLSSNTVKRIEYEFDGFNNISKEYEIAGTRINKTSYYYDKNNRLLLKASKLQTEQYEYDDAGNMIQKSTGIGGGVTKEYYRYDGYNRLNEYTGKNSFAEYEYNLDGLRKSKTVNGKNIRFVYDGANIAGEMTEGNYYKYYRGTELIGYTSFTGERRYYRQDAHGNVTGLLDYSGAEEKSYSYNAYGKEEAFTYNPMGNDTIIFQWKAETEKVHNPFGYCGEYTDEETGLVYLRNRYYDSSTGRFITEDPVKDGVNWYAYCSGNPVMWFDPFGLMGENTKLKRGTQNSPDIMKLQTQLNILGYVGADGKSLTVDGIFGNNTEYAVNEYKNNNGLWNYDEYEGVVGATTWEHLGLEFDSSYESGNKAGSPTVNSAGFAYSFDVRDWKQGALLSAEAKLAEFGVDYKYGELSLNVVSANATVGLNLEYVGVNCGFRLAGGEAAVKIPIPYTDKKLVLGGEGEIGAIGIKSYWDLNEKRIKLGISAIVGIGVSIGLE